MKKIFLKTLIFFLIFFPFYSFAQEKKLSLTITPPLIKVNLSPDQIWQSSVKIVNNNADDLNIFVSVMDFKSGKEGGVVFIKEKEETDKRFLLSQWIEIPKDSILIPAFQSKQIPFTIAVPSDAEPGGKYAAILVGTKPPEAEGTAIKITPLVSSLILGNVKGEIKEEIWIREFSTNKKIFQKSNVQFNLKIENLGNIHIQPQGEIKILNMFGKEKGIILINQKSEYGNILPQSSRKWTFDWAREDSFFEAGRYKAILTLIYGEETKQTIEREISFWIIPLMPLLAILGGILIIFGFIFLIIRIYVKRAISVAISLTQKDILSKKEEMPKENLVFNEKISRKISDIMPVGLKKELDSRKVPLQEKTKSSFSFRKKTILLIIIFIFIFLVISIYFYFKSNLKQDNNYTINIKEEGEILPSQLVEEMREKKETLKEEDLNKVNKQSFSFDILNGSGIKGLANELAKKMEGEGFKIKNIGNAESFNYKESLIKYKKEKEKEAQFLSQILKEKFKLQEVENQKEDIVLIIGQDFNLKDF